MGVVSCFHLATGVEDELSDFRIRWRAPVTAKVFRWRRSGCSAAFAALGIAALSRPAGPRSWAPRAAERPAAQLRRPRSSVGLD